MKTKYAALDDIVLRGIKAIFEEPPALAVPIDVYFEKQVECQQQAKDSEHPINEAEMVRMLQKHMGDSGTLTKKKAKFDKKDKEDRTWKNGKEYLLPRRNRRFGGSGEVLRHGRVLGEQHRRTQDDGGGQGPRRDGRQDGCGRIGVTARASRRINNDK